MKKLNLKDVSQYVEKNILTYQQAEQLYNGTVKITKMSYS